jgi:hypothetical protein
MSAVLGTAAVAGAAIVATESATIIPPRLDSTDFRNVFIMSPFRFAPSTNTDTLLETGWQVSRSLQKNVRALSS